MKLVTIQNIKEALPGPQLRVLKNGLRKKDMSRLKEMIRPSIISRIGIVVKVEIYLPRIKNRMFIMKQRTH